MRETVVHSYIIRTENNCARFAMALIAEFLADCLEYKQLDIVEFLLEHCKELEAGAGGLLDSSPPDTLSLWPGCALQGAQLLGLGLLHTQLLPQADHDARILIQCLCSAAA